MSNEDLEESAPADPPDGGGEEDYEEGSEATILPDRHWAGEFSVVDCRVLGSLIEKEKTTPQNYPLTLNSLRLACNQTSNRDPVLDLDDHHVEESVNSLRERHFTRVVYSTSNRSAKYRHVLDEQLRLNEAELAVLSVLFLRGPQTLGEIKGRTERMHPFADLGAVQTTIDALAAHQEGQLVTRLDRRPGQKDARFAHLMSGPVPNEAVPASGVAPAVSRTAAPAAPPLNAAIVAGLHLEIDDLLAQLAALRSEFEEFRSAFG